MENKFYPDNFEQLLKDTTDNFRMYPSKRVWHSIYNDLHPSRKWPSLAIWILLISSIVYVGISNKNQVLPNKNQLAFSGNNIPASTSSTKLTTSVATAIGTANTRTIPQHSNINGSTSPVVVIQHHLYDQSKQGINKNNTKFDKKPDVSVLRKQPSSSSLQNIATINMVDKNLPGIPDNEKVMDVLENETGTIPGINALVTDTKATSGTIDDLITKKPIVAEIENLLSTTVKNNTTDKEWIEDYAFHHKPFASKWKTNVSYQFYFTPSVGYRMMSKNSAFTPVAASLVATSGNILDYKKALSQSAAINAEIGGTMLYSISKNWNLKFGIQLNYTNYNINAFELKHPTMTTLTLNDLNTGLPELDPRATLLANITGVVSKKLNNNTYQVSLPLGADVKLAGKNNLKWYAGATIQPTYVAGGNAYLVSTDLKNYVADKSLIRNWNLNSSIETFISYKTKGGIVINAGPQLRYQLLSTYSRQYTYDEKLYNIGLKIGISTRL